jgi:hypothetical protein
MAELEITFDEETTLLEAATAIRDHNQEVPRKPKLNENSLVEMSELDD